MIEHPKFTTLPAPDQIELGDIVTKLRSAADILYAYDVFTKEGCNEANRAIDDVMWELTEHRLRNLR